MSEERSQALMELLLLPLPADLQDIGHHETYPRHPEGRCGPLCQRTNSHPDIIKRDLGTAYVTWRRQDHGPDISCVINVRKHNVVYRKRA